MPQPPSTDSVLPYASPSRKEEHHARARAALVFSLFALPLDFLMIPFVQLVPSAHSRDAGLPQLIVFLLPTIVIFWSNVVLAVRAHGAQEHRSTQLAIAGAAVALMGPPALIIGMLMIFGAPC